MAKKQKYYVRSYRCLWCRQEWEDDTAQCGKPVARSVCPECDRQGKQVSRRVEG